MKPETHEGFEVRDLDRALLEDKKGMSISEMIEKGIHVSEELLKEHEFDIQSERERKQSTAPKEEIALENLPEQVFDSEGRPEFDQDGLCIDYED